MTEHFQEAKKLIDESQNILLTMHERMDGDDGGALLALGAHLEKMEKEIIYVIKKGVPPNLAFLPGSHKIQDDFDPVRSKTPGTSGDAQSHRPSNGVDLLITFGCSSKNRCGNEKIMALVIPTINIDHHPDNVQFGQVNLVDQKKSSVAELVYDFFRFNKWPIDRDIATCLLTGMITDTGSFMHSNTQSSTLQAAAALLRKGAHSHGIAKETFKNKTPTTLKAWGRALENSFYDQKHKIIYSVMTQKDLEEFENLPQGAFEGFAETLNALPEAKFAMFLRQDGPIIKGSLRSDSFKNIDVSKIAHLFGGGGHKLAAGFSLAGKLMKDEQGKWKVV